MGSDHRHTPLKAQFDSQFLTAEAIYTASERQSACETACETAWRYVERAHSSFAEVRFVRLFSFGF